MSEPNPCANGHKNEDFKLSLRHQRHNGIWPLEDARGIFCAYVCDRCISWRKAQYRPEIFEGLYQADDLGDDDDTYDYDSGDEFEEGLLWEE